MRRKSARHAGPKRKLYWRGGIFQGRGITMDTNNVVCFWSKWPSGMQDVTGGTQVEPADETVIRTMIGATTVLDAGLIQGNKALDVVLGIIAWDSRNPVLLDVVNTTSDVAPHPAIMELDWLVRIPFAYTRDNFLLGITADKYIDSHAMRKLPSSTGLLCCIGIADLVDPDREADISWCVDIRHLMKSGYYSPTNIG